MTPRGFFSYARDDDKHLGNRLSDLKQRLAGEVSMLLGRDIAMFQDIHDLRVGDKWEHKLRGAISAATFLIPVLTPRYFTRPWCREETLTFLRLAKEQQVDALIFPVLFVNVEDPNATDDEVRDALRPFQYKDFTQWRFTSDPTEKARLENAYALDIVARLRAGRAPEPEAAPSAATSTNISAASSIDDAAVAVAATMVEPRSAPSSAPPLYPVLTVDPFPGRADYSSVQAAIDAAEPGSRILIRRGTYREALRLSKPLELIGDGERDRIVVTTSNGTTLHCDAPMARVIGLTLRREQGGEEPALWITGGNAEIEDCVVTSHSLSCCSIRDKGTAPTLRRCRFVDGARAGLVVHAGAEPSLEDCEFARNATYGVGLLGQDTRATLTRCVARANGMAGFFFLENAQGRLDGCQATENNNCGITCVSLADPYCRNCNFDNNKQSGILATREGRGRFQNCSSSKNSGSGVIIDGSSMLEVYESMITGNTHKGVHIIDSDSGGLFRNNNLTGNVHGAWHIEEGAELKVVRTDNDDKG